MARIYEDDEIPLALVRRSPRREEAVTPDEAYEHPIVRRERLDRMGVGTSGGIAGLFAGAAALGVVHLIVPWQLNAPILRAGAVWGVEPIVSLVIAYVTAAAIGALVGACFAGVTRYLRRWIPLLVWALVFFLSLTLLVLALAKKPALAPAVLAASAAYAFVVSFALPLRKRA
jgi:hypothetical protein